MITLLVLALLFISLAIGTPVGFAMGISGAIGLTLSGSVDGLIGVLQTAAFSSVSAYEMITIPMFMLMAEFVLLSGVADDLFRAMAAWMGRIPGGLGIATAITGAGFGAICGTSTASAATLSSTTLPAMLKQGYDPRLAGGVVAISGTLAMLIPPSVALVIYGLLADVNIGKLLVAGIFPAALITLTIASTIWFLAWRDPQSAPSSSPVSFLEKLRLLKLVGPMLILFGLVTGMIYSGIATPTEASAIGAFGAFLMAFKRRGWKANYSEALSKAARASCMVMMILLGASIFGYFFALSQVSQHLVAWVGSLDISRWIVLVIILFGYIVLGSFMDQIAILVLTIPIVVPLMQSLGFDLVWFGIIKVVTAELGMVTPPIGLNCHIVSRYSGRPVAEVFHGTVPHVISHVAALAILVAFPVITLWLPANMIK
jgi:tripartite ATP-independent transporter DctM subunit